MENAEQLKELGAQAIKDLYDNLTGMKAFALEQAPDFCRQIIAWKITCGSIWLSLLVLDAIAIAATFILLLKSFRKHKALHRNDPDWLETIPAVFGFFLIVSIVIGLGNLFTVPDAIQSLVAPKLVIFDYLRKGH